jgi:hypothetical protein
MSMLKLAATIITCDLSSYQCMYNSEKRDVHAQTGSHNSNRKKDVHAQSGSYKSTSSQPEKLKLFGWSEGGSA